MKIPQTALALGILLTAGAVEPAAQDSLDFAIEDVDPVGPDEPLDLPTVSPAIGDDETSLKTIYKNDDLFGTKLKMERHLGLYLVRFPQRDLTEKITITGKDVDADVWVSIGSQTEDDLACKALQWIVFGRTRWSLGARGIFSDFPDVKKLSINFTNIRHRDGANEAPKKLTTYLTVSLTRSRFEKINPTELRQALTENRCATVAREFLNTYKFNTAYYEEYQDDR